MDARLRLAATTAELGAHNTTLFTSSSPPTRSYRHQGLSGYARLCSPICEAELPGSEMGIGTEAIEIRSDGGFFPAGGGSACRWCTRSPPFPGRPAHISVLALLFHPRSGCSPSSNLNPYIRYALPTPPRPIEQASSTLRRRN
jgi:hypothetical protein